jgi:UDP-2,3-diacylglucosamine pyrophosphatase LpxH
MITTIAEDRLLIISDLHLGSPYCRGRARTLALLRFAVENGYSLCLNGDVLDIVQSPMLKLAHDAPDILRALVKMRSEGLRTYYVVGNHDVVFEYFLEAWPMFLLSPFLNLSSGDKRIRIEHGHLYDPAYARNPVFYQWMTGVAGLALKAVPGIYRAYTAMARLKHGGDAAATGVWEEESSHFLDAAREIADRGFDAVVFGHTHRPTKIALGEGRTYYNCGGWVDDPYYVTIDHGSVALAPWPN